MGKHGVGQPVRRTEDPRFLTGQGRFVDDVTLPGQAYGHVVRSPHAHAEIQRLDVSAAASLPGVLAVLTGAQLRVGGRWGYSLQLPATAGTDEAPGRFDAFSASGNGPRAPRRRSDRDGRRRKPRHRAGRRGARRRRFSHPLPAVGDDRGRSRPPGRPSSGKTRRTTCAFGSRRATGLRPTPHSAAPPMSRRCRWSTTG